ncbi:MAG: choice-of-anchor Q domain-containing protein [Bacteroidota bacterium]
MGSPAAATGNPVAGVTTDIIGTTRSATVPSMGAYETPVDAGAPVITYTAIANTGITGTATYTVTGITITDLSGVATGGNAPQLYFKKTTDAATTFSPNTSAANGWKHVAGTLASGTVTNGVWSFGIDFSLLQTPAVPGDVINYFVVAQDIAATPNVGSNVTGATALSTTTVTVAPPTYASALFNITGTPLSGNYLVGTGQTSPNYATLPAAITSLLLNGINADVNFLLTDATYSLAANTPLTISSFTNAGNNTVTIKPNTGVTSTITGSSTTSIINLNGAKYVTIDGSNSGGTTQNLTVTNTATSTTSAVIWVNTATGPVSATNNTVKNCIVTGSGTTRTLYGIGFGGTSISLDRTGAAAAGNGNNNNTVQNNLVSAAQVGIYSAGNSTAAKNSGNTITGNTVTSAGYAGIYAYWESGLTVSNNNISGVTVAADAAGIALGSVALTTATVSATNGGDVINSTISGNRIGSVVGTGTLSSVGIYISYTATGTNNVVNNSVYGVGATGTSPDFSAGIFISGSAGTSNVYYNSVYMSGTATGSMPTFAFAVGASNAQTLNLKDNVFQNALTGGTSTPYAIGAGMSSFTGYTADYNDFFSAGNTGMTGGLASGTNKAAISNWRTTTAEGSHSISVDPVFNTTANLVLSIGSPAYQTGNPVAGITTDILSVTRNASTPSMGAFEVAADAIPPVVSATAIANTAITGTATYTVTGITMSDVSGINTSTFVPQLYFKKSTDSPTVFSPNSSSGTGWKHVAGTLVSGTASSGTWSFGIDFSLLQTSAAVGDVINWFVVAQDAAASPNLASSPAGVTASSTTAITAAPSGYAGSKFTIVGAALSGSYLIGTGNTSPNYATIPDAITDLNLRGIGGNVSFLLTDASYNLGTNSPVVFGGYTNTGANTLTLKPNTGVSSTITGNSASFILNLYGANKVIIDGSNTIGGTTKNLTVINTSGTSTESIIFISTTSGGVGSTNNVIKNCIVTGAGSAFTASGIGIAGPTTTSLGSGNNNNSIINNTVSGAEIGIQTYGASAASPNTGTLISGNSITSATLSGIAVNFEDGIVITGNTITGVANNLYTNSAIAIAVGGDYPSVTTGAQSSSGGGDVTNATVTFNNIGTVLMTGSTNYSAFGIYAGFAGSTTSVNNISNNSIWGVTGTPGGARLVAGIYIGGGGLKTNVYFNSVSMSGAASGASNTFAFASGATAVGSTSGLVLKNNIFSNSITSSSTGVNYGIGFSASTFTGLTSDYNNLYSATGNLAVTGSLASGSGTPQTSLSGLQAVTGEGVNSIGSLPQFNTAVAASDLSLQVGSPALGDGTPVSGITTDILGVTRSVTAPSMGAYEVGKDLSAPVVSFTAFASAGLPGSGTVISIPNITITDGTGTESGTYAPVMYYKKHTDAGTLGVSNTSAGNGWKYVSGTLASGSATNGIYNFGLDYSLLYNAGGGAGTLTVGDVVDYFFVTQDIVSSPGFNLGATPSAGFVGSNVLTVTSAPAAPSSFTIVVPLAGDYYIGAALSGTYLGTPYNSYATITAALADLNSRGVSAATRFLLTDASYSASETFPLSISSFANSGNNPVTIKPCSACVGTGNTAVTISGASANSVINLNGVSNIIIDGSNAVGGTSRDLTITTTNTTTSPAIIWANSTASTPAANNTVKNCIITGNSITKTLAGIGFGAASTPAIAAAGKTAAGKNNNGNTVSNNLISAVQYGIFSAGTSAGIPNTGNVISGNNILSCRFAGIYAYWESGISISGNTITSCSSATNANPAIGIACGGTVVSGIYSAPVTVPNGGDVTGANISGNKILSVVNSTSGGYSAVGIYVSYVAGGTNNLYNNQVAGVTALTTSPDVLAGILVCGGGITNVYHNSVYMPVGNSPGANTFAFAVGGGGSPAVNVKNNIFCNAGPGTALNLAIGLNFSNYTNFVSDYNNLSSGTTGIGIASALNGSTALTYATWQSTTGKDANSFNASPSALFTSSTDLHLGNGTCAFKGRGTAIAGLTTDFDGDVRSSTNPDVGIDEFTVTGGAGTWTGTVSTDWTNGANWCNGSAPVSTDAVTIPGSTKFQPVFSTGFGTVASVTLNSGGTLTVSGGVLTVSGTFTNTGTLTISGGTLNANGAFTNNALAVINQSGGTAAYGSTFNNVSASPGGIYNLTGGTATITGAVTNRGGAQINISGPGTTANFNGNYTNNGAGSVFTLTAGTANFGGNFTNNATTFSTAGGLINFNKSGAQSITSGNSMSIYALTLSASGTKTAAANFTVTNALTIAGGVTLADGGSSITVNGSISNSGTHSGTGAIILSGGSVSHALSGTGSFGNLTLNDANGVQQSGSEITINGALTFTAGTWTTGVNTLLISSTGSVAGAATGKYVNGNLGNWISGSGPEVYTLGSAAGYTPIALTFSGVTTSGYVVANTTAADNAAIATSCIKATNSANRNWNLAAYGAGTVAYASYTAEVTYVASDLDAGASQAAFVMQLYNGSTWQNLSLPAATTNISSGLFSTSAPGYTAFGALQAGFLTTPGVVVSNNNPSPLCPGGTGVTFTATPSDAGVTPTYVWYLNGTLLPAETASTYTNAAIADGDEVYAVVTSSNSCTTNTAQSNKQKFIVYTTGTWLGLSTTWASAGNWCGGIPDGTTDVTILSTAANMPLISGAASARNLNIAAGATLNLGAGAALSVYGTVDNNGLMNPAGGSRMIIAGSSNQSIGGITVHDLTLDNVAGISLSDNITINNTITFTAGNITTGSNSVIFGTSATDPVETSSGKIIGISEMAARSVGTGSLQFLGVGIDAGTDDLGNVSVKRTTGSAGISTGMGNTGIAATWNITAANQPVQGRGATFTWLDPDFTNGRNTSVMQVFRNETGTWEKSGYYQQPTGTATTKTVRVRTRGFSDWTVSDALNPLPVKLVSFAAVRKNELVEVQWATASEVNDSRFEVERSENNKTWHTVSTVAINGNSSTLKHYKITDAGADMKNNNILSYRLKVVDLDGSVWYTHTAQVTSDAAVVKYSIHPNPFGSELMLDLGTSEGGDAVITVTDVLGRTAASGLFTILPGERTVSLEEMVQKLPNDIFNITVNYNGAVQVLRAIKK